MSLHNRVVPEIQPPRQVLLQQQQQQQHEQHELAPLTPHTRRQQARARGLVEIDNHRIGGGGGGYNNNQRGSGTHMEMEMEMESDLMEVQEAQHGHYNTTIRQISPIKAHPGIRGVQETTPQLKRSNSLVNKIETQPFIREKTPSAKAFKKIVDGQPIPENREGHAHLSATASAFAIVSSHLTRGVGGKGFESLQTATSLLAQIRVQENKAGELAQYIFGFSMIGVLLMVLQNELIYTHRLQGLTDVCVGCEVVKGIITLSTLISVAMLPRLYKIFCKLLQLENMLPPEAKWWNTWLIKQFVVEFIVLLIHFPPFVNVPPNLVAEFDNRPVTEISTELLSLFMFLRVYQFPRILLYRSRYFRESKFLGAMTDIQVSTSFTLRVHAYEYPMFSLSVFATGMLLFCSYSIYLCERYLVKDWFFSTSVWFTAITMTTVGYGNDEVHTHLGRGFAVVAAVAGTVATSLIIVAVNNRMSLTQKEIKVVSLVSKTRFRQKMMQMAAIFIQRAWKYHTYRQDPNSDRKNLWYYKRRVFSALKLWRKLQRQSVTSSAIFQESISSSRIEDIFHRVRTIEEQLEQMLDQGNGVGGEYTMTDELAQDIQGMREEVIPGVDSAAEQERTLTTDEDVEHDATTIRTGAAGSDATNEEASNPTTKRKHHQTNYVDLNVKVDSIATAIEELNSRMTASKLGKLATTNSASNLSFEDSMKNRMNNLQEKLVNVSNVLEATQEQQRQLQEWQVAWQQQFQQQLEAINALQSLLRQQVDRGPQTTMTIPQLQPQHHVQQQIQQQQQQQQPLHSNPPQQLQQLQPSSSGDGEREPDSSTTTTTTTTTTASELSAPQKPNVDKVIELTAESPRRTSSSALLSPLKSSGSKTPASSPLPSISNTEEQ
eukprot:TRINITY_DN757_c0_g1_i1.p1 TRINITY_DN757_c0_g1~~TRINITY_DN757_c0_g1_i1.p1  ORF type:complete len:887 (+),score=233.82 TRINITY_DN757_c0_g1_i1:90-2750(+)